MVGRTAVAAMAMAAMSVLASACGARGGGDGRIDVVAGFARLGEVAARVGGDQVRVRDLTPPGAEPHDLELSTDDVDAILDADLVLYLGGGFQPGVAKAAERSGHGLDLLGPGEGDDPHVWLDPVRMTQVVDRVEGALEAADPAAAPGFRQRAGAFRAELGQLDAEYRSGLGRCQRRVIVTAHAAFGRLARRYGLEQQALTGISPEAEPDPARLARLADLVKARGVTTVFTERLVSPRVAQALAREAGVGTAVLDPLEGRVEGGYTAGMRRDLAVLRTALGCT
jgi:zinc transport system substrate-binding protein